MIDIIRTHAILFVCLLVGLTSMSVQAQTDPIPINQGGTWSYTQIGGTYEEAQPFYPILEKVTVKVPERDDKGAIVKDEKGKPKQIDSTYSKEIATLAAVRKNDKWGFIDKKGQAVVPFKYDFARDFGTEGYAAVGIQADPFPKWTLVDFKGKEITPPKFDGVGDFSDGLASIALIDTSNFDAPTTGFIDRTGKVVIPINFDQAHDFHEGRAAVSKNGLWGFVDRQGNLIVAPKYEKVYDYSEGLAKVYSRVKWGFIDKQGEIAINFQYEEPSTTNGKFDNGLARVRLNNKEGWIDNKNIARISINYLETRDFSDKIAAVKQGGKWGFIDLRGRVIIECNYAKVGDFGDGMAPVYVNGKWGFINMAGKMLIPAKYDDVNKIFQRGIAMVTLGDRTFYIDKTGKEYFK